MNKIIGMRISILTILVCLFFQDFSFAQVNTDNVFALPIRKVKNGQDIEDFKAKRDAYVALLEAEEGTLTDREFQPFFEFTNSGLAVDSVFVGLTSFTDFAAFQQVIANTNGPVESAYAETYDLISFQIIQPLDPEETVDLADLANLGTSQVWECAVRDLSQYANFDQEDYEQKRDAYLAVLAAQNNFVREIQWRSLSDPNVVVGMTVYKDAQSYAAVNADTNFINAYLATGFLQDYPINVYGAIHNTLKGTLDESCNDIGLGAFPEDITVYNDQLYTSHYFNGSINRKNLSTGENSTFVSAVTDEYSSAWGLRIDAANNRLLSIANRPYDFNPANAQAGRVNAYDLSSGNLVASWDLPEGCVGNAIDIDNKGNYYIGDIGPDSRIIKIDPTTNMVMTWADDSQWTDGGFGLGGMVWNSTDGFYVAQGGSLWYVPVNEDDSAGTAALVNLSGTVAVDGSSAINADGMTWAGNNTIFYAENDVFTPGHQGIVHRITLSDATNGTNSIFQQGFDDCSGVYFDSDKLYVNESQFGVAFGVNFVPTSNPFCVRSFNVSGVTTSTIEVVGKNAPITIFPNPSSGISRITHQKGKVIRRLELFSLDGKKVKEWIINTNTGLINTEDLDTGIYVIKGYLDSGKQFSAKLKVK